MSNRTTDFRKGRHVVHKLSAHLVFVPKYRRRCLTPRVVKLMEEAFAGVASDFEATIDEFGWEVDHVHLLISYPPKVALSRLAGSFKGVSARKIRQAGFPEIKKALRGEHFWSASYCVVSTGGASLETVKAYVSRQCGGAKSPIPPRPEGRGFLGEKW